MARLKCPNFCGLFVSYDDFEKLLEEEDFERYNRFLTNRIIEISDYHLWCPGKGCKQVIALKYKYESLNLLNVYCDGCHLNFCLKCKKEAHRPLSCKLYHKWHAL